MISQCIVQFHTYLSLSQQAACEATIICPHLLQVDLLTLKVVSEPRVMWATSVPILVFLDLSVLDLRPMYVTDVVRRQTHIINAIALWGKRHNKTWGQWLVLFQLLQQMRACMYLGNKATKCLWNCIRIHCSIETLSLRCTVFEIFKFKNAVTLKTV